MPLRRAGTVPNAGARNDPGSAAHRAAKSCALRCVRGNAVLPSRHNTAKLEQKTNHHGRNMSDIADAQNLADVIRAQAQLRGYSTAFEFEGRRTSFAGLDIHTNRIANGLKGLGVKPHERIAYLGKNSDIYFELLLGAMKANVVMAPVNWRLAGPEIAFIVEDCKAAIWFVGPEFVDLVRGIAAQMPGVRTCMTTQ